MASSSKTTAGTGDDIPSLISKLDSNLDTEKIKATLKVIRERIHTSRQFYKEFISKFHSLDGVNRLLEILRTKLEEELLIDLVVSILATCCLDKNNAGEMKELNGFSVIGAVLRHYSKSSVSIVNRCARTLANLAKSIEVDELDEDVIPILVQTLEDTEDSGCCHSLLRVLKMMSSCKNKTVLCSTVECGGLRAACKKLKSKDGKLVLLAVETLVSLTAPFNRHKTRSKLSLPVSAANPVLEDDSLSNLFDLLSHHKPDVQSHSWECIDNLMSSDIGRAALGNAGFVKFYLATAKKDAVRASVRERCAHYLCLCCQESVNRAKMLELEGLQFLVDLLKKDTESCPAVPSSLVVAAIAEFRYDKSALDLFARLKLVKVLLTVLEVKAKSRRAQIQDNEKKTSSDGKQEASDQSNRKRKRKKRRDEIKRIKMDVECNNEADALEIQVSPSSIPGPRLPDRDDGLSPRYQVRWHPESPRLSPHAAHPGIPGTSPTQHLSHGVSPPRAQFVSGTSPTWHHSHSVSPPRAQFSGGASPPYSVQHPPSYQFPSSMMSPPKSDSTSPGSSPSYFYDPLSSPHKFFGNTDDMFSPVVSEASESDGTSEESDGSVGASSKGTVDVHATKGEDKRRPRKCERLQSGTTLEQATRKLSLRKETEPGSTTTSEKNTKPQTIAFTNNPHEPEAASPHSVLVKASPQKSEKLNLPSCSIKAPSVSKSTTPSKSPALPCTLAGSIPSSPRTSFGGDTVSVDGERTPSKDSTRTHKHREEEENIILILQEIIHLRHIPAVHYITTAHSMQTLIFLAINGGAAQRRCHSLLKEIFSSRFYFEKLVSHSVPCIIYKDLTWREKQHEKTLSSEDRDERREIRSSVSSQGQGNIQCSKPLEYVDLMQDIAETSFGRKEIEHLLWGHHAKYKLGAALSIPYLYRCGPELRRLTVECKALHTLLDQYGNQPTTETMNKVTRSLCRASRSLLPKWKKYCQKFFGLESKHDGDETSLETVEPGSSEHRLDEECFYRAQEHSADLTLVCNGEEEVRANRQVLAARSEYFACLLTGSFQEAGKNSIRLEGMRAHSLTCFLHSLYDCHPNHCSILASLSKESLDSLLDIIATAKFYMTAGGKQGTEEPEFCRLEQTVTGIILNLKLCDYTVSSLVRFALLHQCQRLLDCCMLFILRERTHLRKHLRDLLASEFRDQIYTCVIDLFR